jgi:hypothetical protein
LFPEEEPIVQSDDEGQSLRRGDEFRVPIQISSEWEEGVKTE